MRCSLRHRLSPLTPLVRAAFGGLVTAEPAAASHARPNAATPLRLPLVPAYNPCTSPNRTHGAPLAFASCAPPVRSSNFLTVGTPDANGAAANSHGFLVLKVRATQYEQLVISLEVSDVRCLPATDASVCSGANAGGGPDYSGWLEGNAMIRISDHDNGSARNEAATVQDIPFPVGAPCVSTADTSTGGFCSSTFAPQPAIPAQDYGGRLTVVELSRFQVFDGGPDGWHGTEDNTVFMRQGIFVP
jgi:hypothetical protein